MRPIDADALFDALYDNEFQTLCPLDEVSDVIDAAPTLDYAPVRHGEWEDDSYVWRCNLCKKWFMVEDCDGEMNFCPNCGAKMDGGEKDG